MRRCVATAPSPIPFPTPGRLAVCAVLSGLLLSGCAGGGDPFPSGRCTLASIADARVLTARGSALVAVDLDQRPAAMMVDTGAAASALSGSIIDRFQIDARMTDAVMKGVDGSGFVSVATVRSLGLGRGIIRDIPMMVMPAMLDTQIDGLPLAGLFGGDFLYNYDVYFDLPDRQVSLYQEYHCPGDLDYGWPGGFDTLPFTEGPGIARTEIHVTLRLDGHEIDATLDSGASSTSISLDDARRVGVDRSRLEADRIVAYTGAMGAVRYGWKHRFASLDIGGAEHVVGPLLAVHAGPMPSLLGADFLRAHRVLISYRRHRIYVERRVVDPADTVRR